MRRLVLVIATLACGCGPRCELEPATVRAKVALAVALVATDSRPVTPAPNLEDAPRPADCWNCDGSGLVGDGRESFDCTVCDRDGDGDPDDTRTSGPSPHGQDAPAAGEQDAHVRPAATLEDPSPLLADRQEALNLAADTGRNVAFIVSPEWTCPPCEKMKKFFAARNPDGWVICTQVMSDETARREKVGPFPYVFLVEPRIVAGRFQPKTLWRGNDEPAAVLKRMENAE